MKFDSNAFISMNEVNQNFSAVSNNAANTIENPSIEQVITSANKIMNLYDEAFKELAK